MAHHIIHVSMPGVYLSFIRIKESHQKTIAGWVLRFQVWKVSLKISHPLSHTILRAIQFMLLLTLMAVKLNLVSKAITNRARFARFAGWTVRKLRLCGFASQKYSTKPQLPNRPCTQRYT